MLSWNAYRREYVNPAGFRNDSPGVWVRENEDGTVDEWQPFRYDSKARCQEWQMLARQGAGPDAGRLVTTRPGGTQPEDALATIHRSLEMIRMRERLARLKESE